MKNNRRAIPGITIIAVLLVVILLMNVLLSSFGDTLSSYLGGGTTVTSTDDSTAVLTDDEALAEGREMVTELEGEGAVLLRNENNTLPLEKGTKVTILGAMSYNYINGGTGSAGGKYDEYTYTMYEAFTGTKDDGSDSVSTELYLDVNEKAWEWLEQAVGGGRNMDTTEDYYGHTGTGELATFSGSEYADNKDNYGAGDWGGYTRVNEFAVEVYERDKDDFMADGYNDVVIVTFGRSGAEGASPTMDYDGDGVASTGTTYLQLSEDEKDLLKFCNENYETVIVLINSSAALELGEIEQEEYGVDACLWIGHPGEAGLVAVAQILVGDVTPSGKLADTYAYDMSTMPSFYNNDDNKYTNVESIVTGFDQSSNFGYYQYEEGIYVGYRFYETADAEGYFDSEAFTTHEWKNGTASGYDEVVQYPFGYGLSYTTFSEEVTASDVSLEAHGSNSITVKVTNTGDTYSGKQVVELYMEAPYNTDDTCGISGTGLQKSSKVLIGYAKTSELAPGESEEVTITFNTDDLASFDSYGHGCYVLETGEYIFHIGEDAHNDATDPVTATLDSSYYYDDSASGVGARDTDETVATVALSDVDAGDGNMLDGYLDRSDFAGGMATIMEHESNCYTEELFESATAALATPALGTSEYTYETYENGVKVTKTVTKYVGGASYLAYSEEENWEGLTQDDERYLYDDVYENHAIENDKVYYVVVDDNGDPVQDADGNYQLTTEETSMRLDVNCSILKEVDYDNEIWAYLVDQLSLDEDITAASSMGWQTPAIESVNKEQTSVVDGPGEAGNGNNSYGTSTWFTSAVVNASTWNPNLLYKMGVVYAHQSIKNGLSGAYAPAMNTHRTPFGGRNFEYFSEDGFLGGTIGAAEVSGIQSQGISVFIKHMALNDNDTNRDGAITWFSEQAAREIYLKDYEISVKYSYVYDEETDTGSFVYGEGALGIMGSLNRDGISMFHQGLYKNILRGEWGFNGMVITDGVGPYAWVMSPGAGLFGGVEGQLGGSAVSAYYEYEGNSTATNYGRYLLRQAAKHMLYQYCHTGGTSASSVTVTKDESWKNFWIAGNVILGAGIVATAIVCFVLPAVNKKKYATVSGEAVAAGGDTIVIPEKEPGAVSRALDKVFHFTARGSTMSGEIWAGLGAFFISVCALIMNTQIIGTAYGNYAGSYLAVTLIAFAGTVLLGALCNLPLVQSASMGLSTILISMLGVDTGLTYANLMLVTFVAAVVYLIVVVTPARKVLVDAIPDGVKKALPVAMGLYIVITGLQNAGIISEGTLVSASSLTTLNNFYFWLMIGATVVYLLFKAFKVKRSATKTFGILIACMWVGGILFYMDSFLGGQTASVVVYQRLNLVVATDGASPYNIVAGLQSLNIGALFTEGTDFSAYTGSVPLLFVQGILVFLFMGLYTNLGYTKAAAVAGDYEDADYAAEGESKALTIGAALNVAAPILGASPTSVGAQSSVDASDGGKTGLSSLAAAVGYLIAMFSWIFIMFFATGTNGVGMWIEETETKLAAYVQDTFVFADLIMVLVGAGLLKGVRKVDFSKLAEYLPFIATVVAGAFLGNIALGVAIGCVAYVIVKAAGKDRKELNASTIILAVVMLIYAIFALA